MIPFWYGKLPSLGDFASRRWPDALLEPWDQWLSTGMATQQQAWGSKWLDAYLQSPSWRFMLDAGALGSAQTQPMAGVVMPSVDKVGRYFPFAVATYLNHWPQSMSEAESLMRWLHQIDDLAADALHEDWSIDTLEAAVSQTCLSNHAQAKPYDTAPDALAFWSGQTHLLHVPLESGTRTGTALSIVQHLLSGARVASTAPLCCWWCEPDASPSQRHIALSRGLPNGRDFAALFAQPLTADSHDE